MATARCTHRTPGITSMSTCGAELCTVEGFDIGLGDRQRRLEPLRHGFGRFGALSAGNLEPLGDVTFDAGREVAQRLVAARAHL